MFFCTIYYTLTTFTVISGYKGESSGYTWTKKHGSAGIRGVTQWRNKAGWAAMASSKWYAWLVTSGYKGESSGYTWTKKHGSAGIRGVTQWRNKAGWAAMASSKWYAWLVTNTLSCPRSE